MPGPSSPARDGLLRQVAEVVAVLERRQRQDTAALVREWYLDASRCPQDRAALHMTLAALTEHMTTGQA